MNPNIDVKVRGPQAIADALRSYKTVILKPNVQDNRNVLTQEMMSERHTKYVIRWNYSLEDATINVPKDCIIEFAGGTIDNGTIVGDNTIMIYNKPIDEVCPAERQGTFIYNTTVADEEDITSESGQLKFKDRPATDGMGRKILRKNIVDGVNTLTQSMMQAANTIYVIQHDFTLGDDITIPANCVLEFDGGSLEGNHTLFGNKCKIIGIPLWGENIVYCDIFDNDGPYLNISKVTNITSFGNTSYTDIYVLDNLNSIIKDITDEYGEVFLVFENGVTYDFGQSILLRDNMTILGNGCTIKFHDVKNQNDDIVTMFNYNSFLTNRKYSITGGIDSYTLLEQYASKNIVIKDIVFDSTDYIGNFWFNVNSPRGIISFEYIDNIKILNCSFIKVTEMPIWFGNSRNVEINGCDVSVSEKYAQTASGAGLLWTNNPNGNDIGISNVYILNNTIDNYGDEAISLFHITDGDFVIDGNKITSKEGISFFGGTDKTNIIIKNNQIIPKNDGSDGTYILVFESTTQDYYINKLNIENNKFDDTSNDVITTQLYTYRINEFIFSGNIVNSKLCNTSYIRINNKAIIRDNIFNNGLWFSPTVSSSNVLFIENNVSLNSDSDNKIAMFDRNTFIINNILTGNITFDSSGYITRMLFRNNYVSSAQITLVADKVNTLVGNIFVSSYIDMSPNEKLFLKDNAFYDRYFNLTNSSVQTATSMGTTKYKSFSYGELICVDGVMCKITSSGYEPITS